MGPLNSFPATFFCASDDLDQGNHMRGIKRMANHTPVRDTCTPIASRSSLAPDELEAMIESLGVAAIDVSKQF